MTDNRLSMPGDAIPSERLVKAMRRHAGQGTSGKAHLAFMVRRVDAGRTVTRRYIEIAETVLDGIEPGWREDA